MEESEWELTGKLDMQFNQYRKLYWNYYLPWSLCIAFINESMIASAFLAITSHCLLMSTWWFIGILILPQYPGAKPGLAIPVSMNLVYSTLL